MNKSLFIKLLLALLLLPARAALLQPLTQDRLLDGRVVVQDPSVANPVTDTHHEARTETAAWASQKSLIASTFSTTVASGTFSVATPDLAGAGFPGLAASGAGSGSFVATTAEAFAEVSLLSSFSVKFQVDEPVYYHLTGILSSQQDEGLLSLSAWSFVGLRNVELRDDGTTVVLDTLFSTSSNQAFDETGTLVPQITYELVSLSEITLRSDAFTLTGQSSASWNFQFGVSAVPEPAAYTVVAGAALAVFSGWRRRRAVMGRRSGCR